MARAVFGLGEHSPPPAAALLPRRTELERRTSGNPLARFLLLLLIFLLIYLRHGCFKGPNSAYGRTSIRSIYINNASTLHKLRRLGTGPGILGQLVAAATPPPSAAKTRPLAQLP